MWIWRIGMVGPCVVRVKISFEWRTSHDWCLTIFSSKVFEKTGTLRSACPTWFAQEKYTLDPCEQRSHIRDSRMKVKNVKKVKELFYQNIDAIFSANLITSLRTLEEFK